MVCRKCQGRIENVGEIRSPINSDIPHASTLRPQQIILQEAVNQTAEALNSTIVTKKKCQPKIKKYLTKGQMGAYRRCRRRCNCRRCCRCYLILM